MGFMDGNALTMEFLSITEDKGAIRLYDNASIKITIDADEGITLASNIRMYFDSTDTYIYANSDGTEDLIIGADDDIILEPDGEVQVSSDLVIGGDTISGGHRGYFLFGEYASFSSSRYLDIGGPAYFAEPATSQNGFAMNRAGSITGIAVNFNVASHTASPMVDLHSFVQIQVRKNGTSVFTMTMVGSSGGGTTYNNGVRDKVTTQSNGSDTFAAGDTLQMFVSITNYSDASSSSVSIDEVAATIECTFDN